jgi:hypothetical protein
MQGANVVIVAGFPPGPIDAKLSLEAAGLLNSAVTVKIV